MKRWFIMLVVAVILWASVSFAAPFLAVDLPPTGFNPTQVQVEVTVGTGAPTVSAGTLIIDGTNFKVFDLGIFATGSYKFRVRWADASGWWSDYGPFFYSVKPAPASGSRIVP